MSSRLRLEPMVSPTKAHTISASLCNESWGGVLRGDDLEPGEMGFPEEKGELPQVGKREGGLLEKEDWPGVCPSRTNGDRRFSPSLSSATPVCRFLSVRLGLPPDLPLASPCLSKSCSASLDSGPIVPGLHPQQPQLSPSPLNLEGTQWSCF